MNSSELSICVLGCGGYAADFASKVRSLSGEISLSFASRDASRAKEYWRRFGGRAFYGSYEEAAADPGMDALYICTPHHLHRPHAELGMRFGKHILVEKPIAHNLSDAAAMVNAAQMAGMTLMVAENVRYMAQVRRCRELVLEGAIGKLRLVQFEEEYPFRPGGWRSYAAMNGGGVLIDGGIHKVHFMRYLGGEPERAFAAELPKTMAGFEGEDGIVATLVWPGGATGLINHSWTAGNPKPPMVEVSGSEGRISFEVGSGQLELVKGGMIRVMQFPPDNRGLPSMVREFGQCILEGRDPETSGEEGLRDLELVLAIYESARLGQSVQLAEYKRRNMNA